MKPKRSSKGRDAARRGGKKKVSVLNTEQVEYVDWKDVNLLRRFMSDRAKIRARRVTGNDTKQQRDVAKAVKNAREMALIPYTNRVTTQRGGRRDRDGDDRRGPRGDRPDRGERGDRPQRDEAAPSTSEFEGIDAGTEELATVAEGSEA